MDGSEYERRVDEAFGRLYDLFEDVDVEDADLETSAGVVRIEFRDGSKVVVNTQRPTQQIWVAGASRGWHFAFDEARQCWVDDRDGADELFDVIGTLTRDATGLQLPSPD